MTRGDEPLAQPDLSSLLASIFDRYGYDLRGYARASLQRRVGAVLARSGLATVADLQAKLAAEPAFFGDLLDRLLVHVSAMFRDPSFYRAFRQRVVPMLRTYARLNIWICGCASGEEAYSTAIVLAEEGLLERAQIYATDLSPRAIERAKAGIYTRDELDRFAANYGAAGGALDLARYFTEAYGRVTVREFVRRDILFFQHDLLGDHVFGEMDVIWCRNVLIYLGREARERAVGKLLESLRPGGFLCLGQSEQLSRGAREQIVDVVAEERIFRQGGRA
ncbi:MAG TPA: protein-glutamate O-methyltransferase CheR [Polyangia bacterium]|nr:protein-glutamate O-methyltransferase CheR [Polyangia bacterium]